MRVISNRKNGSVKKDQKKKKNKMNNQNGQKP